MADETGDQEAYAGIAPPPTKPELKATTAFTVVLLPTGYWQALVGNAANVEIDIDRPATPDDLIPACAQVSADCVASRSAEYSIQRQMQIAQEIQAQQQSQRILQGLQGNNGLRLPGS